MNEDDRKTIEAMDNYGGRFINSLAKTYILADDDNRAIIRQAFAGYWKKYAAMAERRGA